MAVHRVGRTLLLDELDIQELFMRSSQVPLLVGNCPKRLKNLRALEMCLFQRRVQVET